MSKHINTPTKIQVSTTDITNLTVLKGKTLIYTKNTAKIQISVILNDLEAREMIYIFF